MNFGYIDALVASWTTTNIRQKRNKNQKSKNTNIWVVYWLLFCFGFMLGILILGNTNR